MLHKKQRSFIHFRKGGQRAKLFVRLGTSHTYGACAKHGNGFYVSGKTPSQPRRPRGSSLRQWKVETAGENRERKVGDQKARSPWGHNLSTPVSSSSVHAGSWLGRKNSFVLFCPIGEQRVHSTCVLTRSKLLLHICLAWSARFYSKRKVSFTVCLLDRKK